jgi:hypothetical protein
MYFIQKKGRESNPHVEGELGELYRREGRVVYVGEMLAKWRDSGEDRHIHPIVDVFCCILLYLFWGSPGYAVYNMVIYCEVCRAQYTRRLRVRESTSYPTRHG